MRFLIVVSFVVFLFSFASTSTLGAMVVTVSSQDVNALVTRSLKLLDKKQTSVDSQQQVFIGIAGGPGSGKSTVAEAVCNAVNKLHPDNMMAIVIPMDGYHYSKAKLQEMENKGIMIGDVATGSSGTTTTFSDLMSRRGAPWTFDSQALVRDLQTAKQQGQGSFPIYSRDISDPVPDGGTLTHQHKIVYCEGNYLLAFESEDWKPLESIWDETWFVSISEQVAKERLISRHLERWNEAKIQLWGQGRDGAQAKVEASDLKNFRWIQENSRGHYDVIIEN